ncbi:MAG: transporter [Prevotella sp.]|nr:transporter [Prevotella sp.]
MKKFFAAIAVLMMTSASAFAGGILTNTNQSVSFLRNPARDAAIGLDGVYSNPAGVAFMPEGFHIAFNWQYAHQTRTITSTNPDFALGRKNGNNITKEFEGVADAPIIPSLQAAYNTGNWSIQFNFSVPGGGGKCEFSNGLGSFESVVGSIARTFETLDSKVNEINAVTELFKNYYNNPAFGMTKPGVIQGNDVKGYDMDSYMEGRQYYYGIQLGAAYKINSNFSVYGGLRLLYGNATYKAKISNIRVKTGSEYVDFGSFLPNVPAEVQALAATGTSHLQLINKIEQAASAGLIPLTDEDKANLAAVKAKLSNGMAELEKSQGQMGTLAKYSEGVNLLCNQSGLGIAPIIGIDWKYRNFNFAAKYEFKTQMRMKNESTVNEASEIAAVNKFRDGEKVNEDQPAQLAIGVQWSPIDIVRINAGWHHYFDKDVNWYNNTQDLLKHDSNEFLLGAEWDVTNRLCISAGGQLTRYGLSDEYMNDMSFVVNSYSLGLGFSYKIKPNITLSAAYFQTNYENYHRNNYPTMGISDTFTRTNRVLGAGCQVDF